MQKKLLSLTVLLGLLTGLAACGGGGGEPPAAPTGGATPAPTATP